MGTPTKEVAVEGSRWGTAINRTVIDPAVAARLKALVEKTGAPQAWHVRQAIEEYLTKKEQE